MSAANWPRPVTSGRSSRRVTERPTKPMALTPPCRGRAQRGADALGRRRKLVDRDAERAERVVDCIDDGRRCADGAALAEALGLGHRGRRQGLAVMDVDRRHLARRRHDVVGECRGEDVAGVVVDDLFQQRIAEPLRDAAVNLAVDDHRVDQAAGILGDEVGLDRHPSGFDVDLDDRDMAGIRERARRIVGRALGEARRHRRLPNRGDWW